MAPGSRHLGAALQEFLTQLSWDEDRMRSRVASIVAEETRPDGSIGVNR